MVVVTGVWQYKASFRARGAREEATDGLQAGGGLGHASRRMELRGGDGRSRGRRRRRLGLQPRRASRDRVRPWRGLQARSEEHTSELQSPYDLVCRLLLEKKNSAMQIGLARTALNT